MLKFISEVKGFFADVGKEAKQAATAVAAAFSIDTSDPKQAMQNALDVIKTQIPDKEALNKIQDRIKATRSQEKGVLFTKQVYTPLSAYLKIEGASPQLVNNLDTIQILYDRLDVLKTEQMASQIKHKGQTNVSRENRILATEHFLNAYIEACGDFPTFKKEVDLTEVFEKARKKAIDKGMAEDSFLQGMQLQTSSKTGKLFGKHSEFHNMLKDIAQIHGKDFKAVEFEIDQALSKKTAGRRPF